MDIKEKHCNTYTFQKENDINQVAIIDDKTGINSNSPLLNGLHVSKTAVMDTFCQPFHAKRRYKYSVL